MFNFVFCNIERALNVTNQGRMKPKNLAKNRPRELLGNFLWWGTRRVEILLSPYISPIISAISTLLAPIHFTQAKGWPYQAMEFAGGLFWFGKRRIEISLQSRNGVLVQPKDQPLDSSILKKAMKVGFFALIFYYSPIKAPTALLAAKILFRRWCQFKISDPEQALGQGITLTSKTLTKIQSSWKRIQTSENGEGIQFYNDGGENRVFTIDSQPGLIFKINLYDNDIIDTRFRNAIKVKQVCSQRELHLLRIPSTRLLRMRFPVKDQTQHYTRNNISLIVEEQLPIRSNESLQIELHQNGKYAKAATHAVKQTALLICDTNWSDVEPRNLPYLEGKEAQDEHGNQKLALVDLEHVEESPIIGIFGDLSTLRRGLINTVHKTLAPMIKKVITEEYGWGPKLEKAYQAARARRKREVNAIRMIKSSYQKRGIVSGSEPIRIDPNELNLTDPLVIEAAKKLEDYLNLQLARNADRDMTPVRRRRLEVEVSKYHEKEDGKKLPHYLLPFILHILNVMMKRGLIYHPRPNSACWDDTRTPVQMLNVYSDCAIQL